MYKICKKKTKTFDFNESLYNLFFFIALIFLGNSFYNSVNRALKMKHFEYIYVHVFMNVSSNFFYFFNKTLKLKYYISTFFFLFKKSQFKGGKICRIRKIKICLILVFLITILRKKKLSNKIAIQNLKEYWNFEDKFHSLREIFYW